MSHQNAAADGGAAKAPEALSLSVVVPCFNEAGNLSPLCQRMSGICAALCDDYEIVMVNDGSRDSSWAEMAAISAADHHVVAVDLARNYGHQVALSAGLSLARGARVFILDADLQDPPELLTQMMQLMDDGADVVYGQRLSREGETTFKKLSAKAFYRLLSWLSDVPIPTDTGDFRLMKRNVLDVVLAMPEQHRFIRGMVAWAGFTQVALPYVRQSRLSGTTNYNLPRMLRFASDAITGFSIAPLRLSLVLSAVFLAVSGVTLLYALYSHFFAATVPGWTSLAVLVSLFSAVQLFCLGIIGEYIGRIFLETKRRPLFVIREVSVKGAARNTETTSAAG